MINTGERNEAVLKLRLIEIRDRGETISLNGILTEVKSVGFNGIEYSSLPSGTNLQHVYACSNRGDINELESLIKITGASKAKGQDKADVFINGIGFSVKSLQEAPPALVNHTPRFGWLRICNQLGIDITELDEIVAEYWEKRKLGIIKEDIQNNKVESPFRNHKEYLKPILNYFLFKGTGSKDSPSPADYLLDFTNPLDCSTWNVYGIEYLDEHWEDIFFSVRHKGFEAYPNRELDKRAINSVWAEFFQGVYKGSLHVRFRGGK